MDILGKRKRCEDCGDSFANMESVKRHKIPCQDRLHVPENASVTDSSDDQEIYLNDENIDDLLLSFEPSAQQESDTSNQASDCMKPVIRSLVLWTCLFLCLWQSVFFISSSAMTVLLQYIHAVLTVAAEHFKSLSVILPLFPSSIYLLRKLLKIDRNNFIHYVVCPSCFNIYLYSDCLTVVEGETISKNCPFISQPNHPMRHYRRPCGARLLQSVILPSGKKKLIPFKNYYYKPVKDSLTDLVLRKGFQDKCNHWRYRKSDDSMLRDVYDGQMWKTFENGTFFTKDRHYGLMLNLDWFQPFKHTRYSVGVVYMVILNLPRHERFKRENIIIVSVIPHMKKEPPTNTFNRPLVDELLQAWEGGFPVKLGLHTRIFRLALILIGCDIPATRKLCGFLGHSAVQGCSRCKKSFPGSIGNRDYSGFDRSTWQRRTSVDHTREVREITRCNTKQARESLESRYGTRYSVLSELPYLDLIRMSTIDPMHNLFLGTSKHMLHIWRESGVVTEKDFYKIQDRVDSIECPRDIGRIPNKIASGFSAFTADQFKNWTLLFSIYALKDVIGSEHLECWRLFVMACRLLCCRSMTQSDIKIADSLLMRFCLTFERLYGKQRVTPNMHLHGHLTECIIDFGPVYSFWLFSFERCNGILGDMSSNNRNIELQLMRQFLCHSHLLGLTSTDEFKFSEILQPVFKSLTSDTQVGTLASMNESNDHHQSASRLIPLQAINWTQTSQYSFNKYKILGLNGIEKTSLTDMYKNLYQSQDIHLVPAFKELKTIYLGNQLLGSAKSTSHRSSFITAYWTDDDGHISWDVHPRPGQIQRFIEHTVLLDNIEKPHLLAEVRWYRRLPDTERFYCGQPIEAWHPTCSVDKGPSTFMPIQRIKSKIVQMHGHVRSKRVLFVCSRNRYVSV